MSKKPATKKQKPAAAAVEVGRAPPRAPSMTGAELKALLERHGYSQSGMARAIDINDRTMRKYIAETDPVPVTVAYAVQWVIYIDRHGKK